MIPFLLLSILFVPPGDVDDLLTKLRTDDASARRRVQAELAALGPAAVPALLRSLESATPRPEEEIGRLVRQLASASWKERNGATAALVRLGRAAVPVLEASIVTADPEAAWRLRSCIAEIREKAGQDEQAEELRAAAICDVLGQIGDVRAVPPLLKLLGADGPEKRPQLKLRAAQALGLLRAGMSGAQAEEAADRVVPILERAAGPMEKGLLLKALGRLGTDGAVRPIAALLADRSEKNVHLKRSCMAALAAIGRPRGIRAIVDALSSDDVYIRQGAGAVLEELAGEAFGYDPRAGAEENRGAVAKVRAWGAARFGKSWEE